MLAPRGPSFTVNESATERARMQGMRGREIFGMVELTTSERFGERLEWRTDTEGFVVAFCELILQLWRERLGDHDPPKRFQLCLVFVAALLRELEVQKVLLAEQPVFVSVLGVFGAVVGRATRSETNQRASELRETRHS